MSKKQDKTLVLVIVLALILVVGVLAAIVLNNHFVTQRQDKQAQEKAQQQKDEQEQQNKASASHDLEVRMCKSLADDAYWNYVKINATSSNKDANGQDIYYMPQSNWDFAEKQKQNAYSNC